ncbi:MAG: serine/threonine-protein kinase [Pseudomonadota bacterium]
MQGPPNQEKRSVGQYYIMEKIAQGGMAEIYKGLAYDVHGISERAVCIKKILSHLVADKDFIGSIIDEAKLAVKLVHGNIAQTYDLGKVGDDYYMVMEFVDGATLSQINKRCIAQGTLIPIPILAYFISEVAQGLDYMHRRTDEDGRALHIVHRDISPQNIMVSFSGTVKIIDFGIAKAAFKAAPTDSGMLKGKFAYMSPEQAYGDAVDHRSDIYSLGIMMHEFLTGKRLFKASDSRETIRNVRRSQVDQPSSIRPEVPEELDRIAMKALSKDRRHRYPFASEFRDDLIKFLHKNYPEFKSADAAAFVQELFRKEMESQRPLVADSKTPALIIDRSNSAICGDEQFEVTGAAMAPIDLKEFMVEERLPTPTIAKPPSEEPSEIKEPLKITRRRSPQTIKKALLTGLLVFCIGSIMTGLVYYFLQRSHPEKQMAQFAEAMVVTKPADADVSLDGKPAGQGSPVIIKDIKPGEEHIIRVTKDGYFAHERIFTPKRGEFISMSVELKLSAAPEAHLELITTPSGATVFIDDKETNLRTPVTLEDLDIKKEHTIGLYLAGYKFWSKKLNLEAGQVKSFDITLAKNFGSVLIDSDPQGSLVMIDGTPVGQTPLTKEDLDPEKVYNIEIWHEGYDSVTKEIKPLAGKLTEIRVTLEKPKSTE